MKRIIVIASLSFLLFSYLNAYATNGLNIPSFGGAATGMAGASLGISDDSSAMNNNPAGLTQIKNGEMSMGISLLMPKPTHKDIFSNNKQGENLLVKLPMMAYSHRVGNSPLVLGIGIFTQGGVGGDFRDLNTAFGTTDRLYTYFRYAKITPTIAYQATDMLSLGIAFNVGYSDLNMKFFPDTSVAPNPVMPSGFMGMDMKDVWAFGYGAKIGVMLKPSDMISIGAVYTTESKLKYDNGEIIFNMDSLGLGRVKYDAAVDGFKWPQQIGFGIGFRPNNKILIGVDITRVYWSDSMDVLTIKASNPDNPMLDAVGMSNIDVPFKMKWKDTWVTAIGAAYNVTDNLVLRAGFNHAKNPIPQETLNPLFPAIPEKHVTAGIGYTIGSWRIDAAWEHAFSKKITYTNPDAPFGPNAVEEQYQNTIHLFATYKF